MLVYRITNKGEFAVMASQTRYDDRLTTILGLTEGRLAERPAAWAQIADILAQDYSNLTISDRETALEFLTRWQPDVPVERRRSIAAAVAHPKLPDDLVTVFARDTPAVAAPVLASVNLTDAAWLSIIPTIPPASRALLRERRDLPDQAARLLHSYGISDFALTSDEVNKTASPAPPKVTQISDLVARIDAFQRDKSRRIAPLEASPFRLKNFRFETDSDGLINWVEGAPREAILGLSIADMAAPAGFGVDGAASGAFRQRSEIRDANLLIGGKGDASGQWVIAAKPLFNGSSGRLTGYRGVARRRNAVIGQHSVKVSSNDTGLAPDFARQLVHELRTPLNAISGFSEMISQQLLGPVAQSYRQKALHISEQAAKLTAVFDDLESDARLSTDTFDVTSENPSDARKVVQDVLTAHKAATDDLDVNLRLFLAAKYMPVAIDPQTLRRLVERMLMIILGAAAAEEVITLRLIANIDGNMCLEFERPASLIGVNNETMLDPSFEAVDQSSVTPALGVAFTLRLIGKLARAFRGRLSLTEQHFALILPLAIDNAAATKESS